MQGVLGCWALLPFRAEPIGKVGPFSASTVHSSLNQAPYVGFQVCRLGYFDSALRFPSPYT